MRRFFLTGALILAAAAALPAAPAGAKSFAVERIAVDAVLNADATMDVVEHATYHFDGEFHRGVHPLHRGGYQISGLQVSERGAPLPFDGAPYDLHWYFTARNETRTFDIAYRVTGAARVGSDVADLYWQWLGTEHPAVGEFDAVLRVPGDGVGLRAWGHGPSAGQTSIDGATVHWHLDGVPAGRFVEGRVAVPAGAMTAAPDNGTLLPSIMVDERRIASGDGDARSSSRPGLAPRWWWWVPAGGWFGLAVLWMVAGREPRPRGVPEYVREPLDDPPAVASALLDFGEVRPRALTATVLDLAARGFVRIEDTPLGLEGVPLLRGKGLWRLVRRDAAGARLTQWEHNVLAWLFAGAAEVSQLDFAARGTGARAGWDAFAGAVKAEVAARRYVEGRRAVPFAVNLTLAGASVVAGIVTVVSLAPVGFVAIVAGFAQAIATATLRRRTRTGAQRAAEWKAFAHFLDHFSHLDDAPTGHLALWDRYLVYGAAVGVSKHVLRDLALRVPVPAGAANGPDWFAPDAFDSFASGFGESVHTAAYPSSSGSSSDGGGGSFSDGGGDGGGGGGWGAD